MFSPEELAEINRVDIQLRFGVHGYRDRHYSRAIRATQELDPCRGDVLAIEGPGYNPGYNNYFAYALPFEDLTLAQTQQFLLRSLRKKRIFDAFAHAAYAASFRDIQTVNADANAEEWETLKHLPLQERRIIRERHAIEDLGQHALRMAENPERPGMGRPVLMLLFGSAHQQSMEQQCRQIGMTFSSKLMPNRCDTIIDNIDTSLAIVRGVAVAALRRANAPVRGR